MALFDEMEAETEAERKRKERERRAAAANGRGNGANAVTSASLGLDGDDTDLEPDVPPVESWDAKLSADVSAYTESQVLSDPSLTTAEKSQLLDKYLPEDEDEAQG